MLSVERENTVTIVAFQMEGFCAHLKEAEKWLEEIERRNAQEVEEGQEEVDEQMEKEPASEGSKLTTWSREGPSAWNWWWGWAMDIERRIGSSAGQRWWRNLWDVSGANGGE